ncbi:MAG: RpiB/LacA/LacB family sugar-phosphate isomerase [Bacillota bacterium]
MKTIMIGADASGFDLKEAVKSHLESLGYTVDDIGMTDKNDPKAYFEVAHKGALEIQSKNYEMGILICGTGMGMSITANKHEGVHAAACESVYTAEKARAINNANVLTMGGWVIGPMLGSAMAETFMATGFTDNLEDWRKEKVANARKIVDGIEKKNFNT